jgi:hypothetical protein
MSMEVGLMAADYAALEARVAELEQQMRHMPSAKVDAISNAVSLVHEDTRYLRDQSDIPEVLRRLPPGSPTP